MKASNYSNFFSAMFAITVVIDFARHIFKGVDFPLSGDLYLIASAFFGVSSTVLKKLERPSISKMTVNELDELAKHLKLCPELKRRVMEILA